MKRNEQTSPRVARTPKVPSSFVLEPDELRMLNEATGARDAASQMLDAAATMLANGERLNREAWHKVAEARGIDLSRWALLFTSGNRTVSVTKRQGSAAPTLRITNMSYEVLPKRKRAKARAKR